MTARRAAELLSPPHLAIAANASTPNPGMAGVQVWSTVETALLTWNGTAWVTTGGTGTAPYDVHGYYPGGIPAGAVLLRVPLVRATDFAADFAGSHASASAPAAAEAMFTVAVNGTAIGTFTFAAAASAATFSTVDDAPQSCAAGGVLSITAPDPADATLADVGFGLAGTR